MIIDLKDGFLMKLIDFGAAIKFAPNQKLEEPRGTAFYIAPEVISSKYDNMCDLWSVGVMLYFILSG